MRYPWIDILRSIAIILMISFHAWYLWVHEFDYDIFLLPENIWSILGKTSALLFMLLSGVSYALAEKKYGKSIYRKYFFAGIKLLVFALMITGFTYFFFQSQLIVFGVLHFFALSFFLLPYALRFPLWVWLPTAIILAWGIYFFGDIFAGTLTWIILWFPGESFYSADYYPLFPYFLYIYAWAHIGRYFLSSGNIEYFAFWKNCSFLAHIGRHSLLIYMLHQPIIFFFFFLKNFYNL